MNFLYPGFLFALLAVLIPVLIHLFNFRKFKKVYFSNVDFLKEIRAQNSSREQLKHLLILLCRMLAIAFLIFAFARPFISSKEGLDTKQQNIVSIYLDNSYSMEAVNKEGSLLDEAKRKAKEIVKSYGINDRFHLLTNDFEGRHQRLLNAEEFLQAIDEIKISAASKNMQQVINRQEGIFNGNANRFSYIISDFQKSFSNKDPIKTGIETSFSLVKINATPLPNLAVDSVWFLTPIHRTAVSEKIVVRVKNYSNEPAKNVVLKLTINDQQKAVSSLSVDAEGFILDTLSFSGLSAGWQKALVSIKDYPMSFDDDYYFTFKVSDHQNILAINGDDANYLKAAFGADPYFKLIEFSEKNIAYSRFGEFSLVVLNGLSEPSTGLGQAIKNYVNEGGAVVIFPNTGTDLTTQNSFFLAANLPSVVQLVNEQIKVSQIELKHPIFKDVFSSFPKNIDLPKLNKYFNFQESNKVQKENILQLANGSSALARYSYRDGQVFLWSTGLNEADGNLGRHPLFVPILYKMAFQSAKDLPLYYALGTDQTIQQDLIRLGASQSLRVVADGFEAIPDVKHLQGKTQLYIADQIKKAGFYNIKQSDSTLSVVAFNNNRSESELNYNTQNDLEKFFENQTAVHFIDTKSDNISSAIASKNNGTDLWKLCLILSLVFIAAEIILVRFFNPTNKYQSS